jgi:hypothetical protein
MMIMGERLWGLALVAIGSLWMWDGWSLWQSQRSDHMFDVLGPDRYLMLVGGLLIMCGVIIGLQNIKGQAAAAREQEEFVLPYLNAPKAFALLMTVYAVIIPVLGYALSTLLFFMAAYTMAGRQGTIKTAMTSVLSAGLFYVIFETLAHMSLPKGIFGI